MMLGYGLAPLAALMGVPWQESALFGSLLGEKIVVTELVAYGSLSQMMDQPDAPLGPRTAYIAT